MKTISRLLAVAAISVGMGVTNLAATSANADVDISLRMANRMRSDKAHEWVFREYLSIKKLGKIKKFLSHPSLKDYNKQFEAKLQPFIQDGPILSTVAYLNYKKSYANLARVLDSYYFDKMLALQEIKENPRLVNTKYNIAGQNLNPSVEAHKVLNSIDIMAASPRHTERPGSGISILTAKMSSCISVMNVNAEVSIRIEVLKHCIIVNLPKVRDMYEKVVPERSYAALDLRIFDPFTSGSSLGKAGFVPGNEVSMLNRNRTAQDSRIEKIYAASFEKIVNPYKKRWEGKSNRQMIEAMRPIIRAAEAKGQHPMHAVFEATDEVIYSDAEGKVTKKDMFTGDKHPQLQYYGSKAEQPLQVFPNIADVIRSAKSTVFIDMFFFGGTTSAAIGELVISRLKAVPELRAVILHDELNGLGLDWEIRPVWNFMRAYMAEHPDRLLAIPANVYEKKVLGIPEIVGRKLDNAFFSATGIARQLENLKGTADHSKVVIADANVFDKPAQATVGSKNWADTSGALSNDETVKFKGPHAHVVFDEFYEDFYRGIAYDWAAKDTDWLWNEVYAKGFAQASECRGAAANNNEKVMRMLCPFDLLNRYKTFPKTAQDVDNLIKSGAIGKIMAKESGQASLRSGGHNWDGSFRSALNQDLEVIYRARKQILISEQYVAQPHIVRALIMKAAQGVKVNIVVEGFTKLDPPGFPNVLYLEKLKSAGIKVRFKKHASSSWFPGEFHGKTLSIDGWSSDNVALHNTEFPPILIIGSANKDFMTLTGAFREAQVEVLDSTASKQHDQNFWRYFNSDNESYPATLDSFNASQIGQKLAAQGVSSEDFMEYTRWLLATLYEYRVVH